MPSSFDDLAKALGLLGALYAFRVGLIQYRTAQQWKRAEWVAQEMKALFAEPLVQAALLMIDWQNRKVPLHPDEGEASKRDVYVTDDSVAAALAPHSRQRPFSALECEIRGAFDRLLDGLERLNSYVTTGLVTDGDLTPYLAYWASRVCGASEGETRLAALRVYMTTYGFAGALDLLERQAARAWSSSRSLPGRHPSRSSARRRSSPSRKPGVATQPATAGPR